MVVPCTLPCPFIPFVQTASQHLSPRRTWGGELRPGRRRPPGISIRTGSSDKKYVNVVGGPENCRAIGITALELKRAGFTDEGRLSIVPGPLLVATTDSGRAVSHMPLDPGSAYPLIHESLARAYELANEDSPDPQLDLGTRSKPRWAHHSNRRGSNTVARRTQALTGATEMEIDLTYGWQERFYNLKMQVHYEARFDRVRRAAVSSLI